MQNYYKIVLDNIYLYKWHMDASSKKLQNVIGPSGL